MTPPKPAILIIAIDKESFHDELLSHLLGKLHACFSVTQATSPDDAAAKLNSLKPKAVLITDASFAKRRHHSLISKVENYVRNGGTVVFCGMFSSCIRPDDFDAFFLSRFGLPWKFGAYHRTTFVLNPSCNQSLRSNSELPASYSMKAVHVTGAPREAAVYVTSEKSVVESRVFAPSSVHNLSESPVLFQAVDNGYVGWVGDVNNERGTAAVILAMCNFGGEGRCRVCGKEGDKKCAQCLNARYCSKECQAKDWKTHKTQCKKG
jgi:hypothetical protein